MDELEYSPDAIDVLNQFHEVNIVVLVEGDGDSLFWGFLFDTFYSEPVKVRGVGGKSILEKYVDDLEYSERNYYVAMDSDYEYLFATQGHEKVLCTLGHSIENSLICGQTLCDVIQSLALVGNDKISPTDCWEWINEETAKLKNLVYLEFDSSNTICGTSILGDNSARHQKSPKSPLLCPEKLENQVQNLGFITNATIASEVDNEIEDGLHLKDLIRGHYLFSMCFRYVKHMVEKLRKNISLSNDALFAALLMAFKLAFSEAHDHYQYYLSEFQRII